MSDQGTKRIILHVGTAKTGTTSLQSAFYFYQEKLFAHGVHYPNLTGCGFSWHIDRGISTGNAHLHWKHDWPVTGNVNRLRHLIEETLKGIGAAKIGLLSAEYLSTLAVSGDFFEMLDSAQTELGCKIEIVAYIRDPFQMFVSSYLQSILDSGFFGELDDFVDEFLTSNKTCSFAFQRNILDICQNSTRHGINFSLYRYEDATPDVVNHFFSNVLGVNQEIQVEMLPKSNKRMSKIDYDFIRGMNSYSYLFGHLISLEQRDLLLNNPMPVSPTLETPYLLSDENSERLIEAFQKYKNELALCTSVSKRVEVKLDQSLFVDTLSAEQVSNIEFAYELGAFVARSLEGGYLKHHFENAIQTR